MLRILALSMLMRIMTLLIRKEKFKIILTKTIIHRGKPKPVSSLTKGSTHKIKVQCPTCKNIRETQFNQIYKNGHCTCLPCERKSKRKFLNIGDTYNKLTIIGHSEKSGYSKVKCACGKIAEKDNISIKSGKTKSCGCLRAENMRNIKNHRSGEEHHNWKGGISKDRERHMASKEYKDWRQEVFLRDKFTCQKCSKIGGELNAHHLNNYANFKEERTELNNGVTLCYDCHLDFHKVYGRKCVADDFYKYLKIE